MLHSCLIVAALHAAAGCAQHAEPAPLEPADEKLTPELAKAALLEMMRSKEGKELGWFDGDVPAEMAKMKFVEEADGWFAWTAAFRFHPANAIYTFAVNPKPGARACRFEYEGVFAMQNGAWSASPPKPVRTILQP